MKHLKKFNESTEFDQLQEFCETCLAYLLDDGFTTKIDNWNKTFYFTKDYDTRESNVYDSGIFEWNDNEMISLDDIIDVNDGDVGVDSITCIEIKLSKK